MESTPAIKRVSPTGGYARAAKPNVTSDLSQTKIVTAAADSSGTSDHNSRPAVEYPGHYSEPLIDPQTREVIYRAVMNSPEAEEETKAKLRAYAREPAKDRPKGTFETSV